MNTQTNNRTVGLVVAILLLIASFVTEWADFDWPPGQIHDSGDQVMRLVQKFAGPHVEARGTNAVLVLKSMNLPVWIVIAAGLLAVGLMLLNQRGITSISSPAIVIPLVVSAVGVFVALSGGIENPTAELFSSGQELHLRVGPFLALAALIVGALSGLRNASRPSVR